MSDEKTKTQQGPGGLQRETQGGSGQEADDLRKVIQTCERKEAALFAQRGYGGYIETEELAEIRKRKASAKEKLEAIGSKAAVR